MKTARADGSSGVARNIPITAQKIASWVTRGFVSAQYWDARCPKDRGVADSWPRMIGFPMGPEG
jgi:hypothetical protein